ncbi:MAG: hypothetical protein GF313_02465 [Caldithrix sp.]|nr:hypothetical protein [Caldithrix sp.]
MTKKLLFMLPILLLLGFSLTAIAGMGQEKEKHPDVDFTQSCRECHAQVTPEIHKAWKESAHGRMNFSCYMCHGDGTQEFHVKPGSETCISCHSDQEVDFSQSKVDNCFDCHQGHSLKFHEN